MVIFAGIDWAEAHHDVCVLDEVGMVLAIRRIADTVDGVSQLQSLLAEHSSEATEVVIGIETDRGLLVRALLAAGHLVYAINPLAASRAFRSAARYSLRAAPSRINDSDPHVKGSCR